MTWPVAFGRKLPHTDWEGDDPLSGVGNFVTCMDTAVGRMAAWATNLRINPDGKAIRAKIYPRDPDGVTMAQAAQGLHTLTGLHLNMVNQTLAQRLAWLRAGRGLVVPGTYCSVPRAYRFQTACSFNHAIFFCYIGSDGVNVRVYDPLNPNIYGYGEWRPLSAMKPFLSSLPGWQVGYVPLQAP